MVGYFAGFGGFALTADFLLGLRIITLPADFRSATDVRMIQSRPPAWRCVHTFTTLPGDSASAPTEALSGAAVLRLAISATAR